MVKFTHVKIYRGKFTTGKNFYHGVCNRTSFSEEKQKALKPRSQGKYGIFIIMDNLSTLALLNNLLLETLFTVKPHD